MNFFPFCQKNVCIEDKVTAKNVLLIKKEKFLVQNEFKKFQSENSFILDSNFSCISIFSFWVQED